MERYIPGTLLSTLHLFVLPWRVLISFWLERILCHKDVKWLLSVITQASVRDRGILKLELSAPSTATVFSQGCHLAPLGCVANTPLLFANNFFHSIFLQKYIVNIFYLYHSFANLMTHQSFYLFVCGAFACLKVHQIPSMCIVLE